MIDDLVSSVLNLVSTVLSDVHTSMPGTVVSYDPATRRAVVRPALSKQLADGRVLAAPQIVSVPVIFPTGNGGNAAITFPLVAGDGVQLHFSERSLEAWHDGGNPVPDDPRAYDLSDAIAVPGLNHGGATVPADPVNMVVRFGPASIVMTPEGHMLFSATSFAFIGADRTGIPDSVTFSGAAIVMDGPVNAPNYPITSMGVVLPTHIHADAGGAGNSGPPIPI